MATTTVNLHTLILNRPRVTEKSTVLGEEGNVYTFNVAPAANKALVKEAVEKLFKVKPLKVHMITVPKKTVTIRGKRGTRGGGKKALVFLKKGDKIEFV